MNLIRCSIITVCLVCLALSARAASTGADILLEGTIPSSITGTFLENHYNRLWQVLAPGVAVDETPLRVIFYSQNNARQYGVRLPEWGGGGAVGRDTIVVPLERAMMDGMDVGRVTVHELVHIVLERSYGDLGIPRWFHEGLAMTLSGEVRLEEQIAISRAIVTRRLLSFEAIEQVNGFDETAAALAYSQSHFAVAYLFDEYGFDTLPVLLAAVRETGSLDSALVRVLGFGEKDFESFAREYLVKRYALVFLVSDTAVYWLPITLLFFAAVIAVKVRNKKRRRMMAEEERMEEEAAVKPEDGDS